MVKAWERSPAMTTNPYDFQLDERPTDHVRAAFGAMRLGKNQARSTVDGMVTDEASGMEHYLARRPGSASPRVMTNGWSPAHSEAARFLGECFIVGALLGVATESARPMWGQRHG
jgi:hypothetical protein